MLNLRSVIGWLLVFTQVWTPVLSQTLPIVVDKSVPGQRAIVGVSGNGVPVVNIARPTDAGVSNNRFTQFNVGPAGVVLNNSGAPSQSQLAGGIAGNPLLGNSRAAVIINQVTANNPSLLRGMMEVAGHRANVIVANPAGITCDGCGFLNAHRGTLTTGRPMIGTDGGLQGFDVTRGRLSIEGDGLFGKGVDRVDLITRTLVLNAAVWANRLDVVAGPATVGYADDSVHAKAGDGPAPKVWLDTAALGGMYANSIRLVGTEAGVGVNLGGRLNSLTGRLQLTSAGDLRILPAGEVHGAEGVNLSAGGNLTVQGRAMSPRDIQLTARQGLRVDGTVATGDGAGMALSGHDIHIGATGKVHSGGPLLAEARGRLDSAGELRAPGQITLRSTAAMTLAGTTVSETGDVRVQSLTQGITMTPSAHIGAAGALNVTAQDSLITDGRLAAGGPVVLRANGDLETRGKLEAHAGLTLKAAGTLTNAGELWSGQSATLEAGRGLENRKSLQTEAGMALNSKGTLVNNGDLWAGQSATLHADGNLENRGTARIGTGMTLTSNGTLINSGDLRAGHSITLHAEGDLENRSTARTAAGMKLTSKGTLVNSGELWTGQSATLHGDRQLENRGTLRARGGMLLTSNGALINGGGLLTPKSATLRAHGNLENSGTIVANAGATLWTPSTFSNRGGEVQSDSGVRLDIGDAVDNRDGKIRSVGKLYAGGTEFNNQAAPWRDGTRTSKRLGASITRAA